MKLNGKATVRVDPWGRVLFITMSLPEPLTSEEATKIHDKSAKVCILINE